MTKFDDQQLARVLKSAISSVNPILPRDLWPAMLQRMQRDESRMRWYDWALIAGLFGWGVLYPQAILQLLYQL